VKIVFFWYFEAIKFTLDKVSSSCDVDWPHRKIQSYNFVYVVILKIQKGRLKERVGVELINLEYFSST
jgi:hypothetical protein